MAYMNQVKKAAIAAELKKVMPAGWKYSLAVSNHSTIVCTIASAPVDLIAEYNAANADRVTSWGDKVQPVEGNLDVNHFHYDKAFTTSLPVIEKIIAALNLNNHDRSDSQTDYFDVGHYVDLNVGRWDKPFAVK